MKTPVVQPAPIPAASVSEFIATFAVVLAVIVALFLFDTALARVDIRGRKSYAAREFRTGEELLAQGKIELAIEHLRTASTLDDAMHHIRDCEAIVAHIAEELTRHLGGRWPHPY